MLLTCPECCDETAFEQPPCEDGHGVDCPEWSCVDCGFGLLLATYPEIEMPAPRPVQVIDRRAA
jgi:hypothetical protein